MYHYIYNYRIFQEGIEPPKIPFIYGLAQHVLHVYSSTHHDVTYTFGVLKIVSRYTCEKTAIVRRASTRVLKLEVTRGNLFCSTVPSLKTIKLNSIIFFLILKNTDTNFTINRIKIKHHTFIIRICLTENFVSYTTV